MESEHDHATGNKRKKCTSDLPDDIWKMIAIESIRGVREAYPSGKEDMYEMARFHTDCPCYGAERIVELLETIDNLINFLGYKITPLEKGEDGGWEEKCCKIE